MNNTPFHVGVDPQDILASMMPGFGGHSFMHAEDNQVQYYMSHKEADRGRRYSACHWSFVLENNLQSSRFEKCEPQLFHVGNIVEV